MLKIEIKSADVNVKSGVGKSSHQPYEIRTQEGYAHLVGKDGKPRAYPERIEIPLDKEQPPYKVGTYTLAPASFYVGDFFKMSVQVRLVSSV